jgi:putative nucleotidyltransferase with HDIG domain
MVALCCVTIATVVQAWRMPFPFRLDQKPGDGVVARIDFKRVNQLRTSRDKDRAAEEVPYIFRNDPTPLRELPSKLKAALLTLAQSPSLESAPAELRRSFGLLQTPSSAGKSSGDAPAAESTPEQQFQNLKGLAQNSENLAGVLAALTEFLKPMAEAGLVRPEHYPAPLTGNDRVEIRDPVSGESRRVALAEIQLAQLLGPGGRMRSAWSSYPVLAPYQNEFEQWLLDNAPETLKYDEEATRFARQSARDRTPPSTDGFNQGDLLVSPGEELNQARLDLLWAEYQAMDLQQTWQQRLIRFVTAVFMLGLLAVLIGYHLVRHEQRLVNSFPRLAMYLALMTATIALSRALSFDPWRAEVAPLLVTTMIVAVAYNQVLATITAFSLALVLVLSTGANVPQFMVLMTACCTSVIMLPNLTNRSRLVIVGGAAAVSYFVIFWAAAIVEDQSLHQVWLDPRLWIASLRGAGWCIAAGFLVSGSLPFIENVFGVVTDISLLELGDVSHPLLQELVRRAPGTYNHSMAVASIAETAADRIGANGLLVRVGAYFHDVGKMLKPDYFVENQLYGAESRHDSLAPAMSTLIIIGHVKDGSDLAHQHHLPQPLIDFIEQHHGTTLVEYFYHEAMRQADEDHKSNADESHFRYPGPKPQTREAAVLMIADAVEGASRTLSEPSPSRLERLVHDIAMKRLLDGQFDECGLTMTEISRVTESLTKSLLAMYHGRVKYPEQQRTA